MSSEATAPGTVEKPAEVAEENCPQKVVTPGTTRLQANSSFVPIDDTEIKSSTSSRPSKRDVVADTLHKVFLWLAIPLAIYCGLMAIILYSTHYVQALTVSHAVAGYCAVASCILTTFLIYLHATVYTNPKQQRLIVRILLMVPIYALDSFLALVAYHSATVISLVRDTYEAYVIYMFFHLLMDYLHGEDNILAMWAQDKSTMKHLFPFTKCLPEFGLNRRTLKIWKLCLTQYMILNPLLTLLSIPLYYAGHYEEGKMEADNSYLYFAFIRFVSVTFAFTSLVYFFFAVKDYMMEHKPLAKFAAIKTVVFLTFWQSVLIGVLNYFKLIPHTQLWTANEVSTGLNNFIICIEMFFICIAHRWVFSDVPYRPIDGRRPLQGWVLCHMISIRDVLEDTHQQLLTPLGVRGKKYDGTDEENPTVTESQTSE